MIFTPPTSRPDNGTMGQLVTILLVEDDQSMLNGMSDLLQAIDIGYDVHVLTASNGREALRQMAEHIPNLIVSDIMMPHMDGYQLLEEVRKNPGWLHIPFIFLTAKGDKREILEGHLSGVDLYITKPFASSELLELIKSQLDKAAQLQITRQHNMDALKKGILQILNHEFRTPLTYVTAYYEMLADGVTKFGDSDNFQEYLRGIQAGSVRLTKLVEDFIAVIELRTGEAQANYEERARPVAYMSQLLRQAIHFTQERAEQQGVQVHYNATQNLPTVFGDPESLHSVFVRLLDNAIKFTYGHKRTGGHVFVSAGVKGSEVHLVIADEGVGFPKQIQDRLFELFFQHNRGLLEQQGAGIGLTIAKGLVDLHQGRIEVESGEDKGSKFTIVLPVYKSNPHQSLPKESSRSPHKRATVLIVEDDPHLLDGLKELLEIFNGKYQLNVLKATNGRTGLEVLATEQPDLIISDIMMPAMDGFEFLREVRQNPEWIQIPFIFLTAKGERSDIHRGWQSGIEAYITKPYDSDELLGLVVTQLDRHFQVQDAMAKDFDALKRSILNLITPDFRMPLTSVTEYSDKLAQSLANVQTAEELKNSLRGIKAGGLRLTRLIEDFISLAELKTGEAGTAYTLRAQPLDGVGFIFHEASQTHSQAAKARGIQIHCPVTANLPPILSDGNFLLDSVCRLLEVGIAYCEETEKEIVLSVSQEDDSVHLSVSFATTFNEDEADKIIAIFTDKGEDMLGLPDYAPSLYIVKGYVELHGGRVAVTYRSHHPHTCTFTIILPVHASS